MSISCQGTKTAILSLFPFSLLTHSEWKKLPMPLAVDSYTISVSGSVAMAPHMALTKSAGVLLGVSFQNATSDRCAIA